MTASCGWREVWRRGRQAWGAELFRYTVRVDWCWSGSRIYNISVSLRPEITWFCCWRFVNHIGWDVRNTGSDYNADGSRRSFWPSWPYTRFTVFSQGKFEQCFPLELGCPISTRLPWVELTVEVNGRYSYRTGGTSQ